MNTPVPHNQTVKPNKEGLQSKGSIIANIVGGTALAIALVIAVIIVFLLCIPDLTDRFHPIGPQWSIVCNDKDNYGFVDEGYHVQKGYASMGDAQSARDYYKRSYEKYSAKFHTCTEQPVNH